MKPVLLSIFILAFYLCPGQDHNILTPEKNVYHIRKKHPGKIIFLSKKLSPENIKESDILTSTLLQEDQDLDIHAFFDNSLVNYLHQIDPVISTDELLKNGNYQFSFYVDKKLIY